MTRRLAVVLSLLAACAHAPATTTTADVAAQIAAEKAMFAAIAARDEAALRALLAPDFTLSVPGQPEADRAAFVAAILGIPGEILGVDGERLAARRWGDTGIVTGDQIARVKIAGEEVTDRGTFVDVFARRDGRWVMTYAFSVSQPSATPPDERAVAATLDDWHAAAAASDEERYFAHFTPDAVFLGTDGTERWTRDELRAWAKPRFDARTTWRFHATARHVSFSPDGNLAWFDEALDTPNLGPSRGSGVLVRSADGGWKIAQYNLSVPIPNEIIDDVTRQVSEHAKRRPSRN